MADVAVKPEIKLDPDDKTDLADVDEFEEDTDLQIPANPAQGWLTRVPPELWQAWNEMYKDAPSDQPIQIGNLRVFDNPGQNGERRLELHLQNNIPQTREVPQKYEIKLTSEQYNNSVVFSEKDLPGHRSQQYGRNRHSTHAAGSKPTGIDKAERIRQNKKFGGYSSVIPKQTFLAAKVNHEASLIPMKDENYYANLERSLTMAMAPKVSTTFQLDKIDKGLMPGRQHDTFNTFTTSSKLKSGKKKTPKEKAVRMPQDQLYTALYACFKKYKYWKMGSLRNHLKQPEAYIKATLEQIAYLIRSGDFVGTYAIKPEYEGSLNIMNETENPADDVAKVESAGDTDMGSDGVETEGDGDEGDFEDVKMEG